MGMYDEVLCSHELFGMHKGETHRTASLRPFGGRVEQYEITSSGRLELLEYAVDHQSNLGDEGRAGLRAAMTMAHIGGRRDLNYHGCLVFDGIGRARFMDGMMVALESEFDQSFGDRRHTSAPKVSQHDPVHDSSWVMEAPIYSDGQMGGTLRVHGDVAEARCQICGYTVRDVRGLERVLETLWRHLVFEGHSDIDIVGVDGLSRLDTRGITLAVQIVVNRYEPV